jgi:ribosomal protein S18 acetylase RimI-like enzyme
VLWQGCAAYSAAGATVVQHDRIRWFATGVGYEGLNGVFIDPGTPAVPVEDALRTFHHLRVPALWHVATGGDQPAQTGPEPITRQPGVSWYEGEPLMATRIGRDELPRVNPVRGLSILPAHGAAGISAWVEMWSGLTDGPVFDGIVRARLGGGSAFTHLLAVLDGEPVGCAAAFVGEHGGEVQHVLTLPAVRRRGIGRALTVAALRTIAARGADTAVLTSSAAGLRIYQRLGFRRVGWVRRYLWSPATVEMPA